MADEQGRLFIHRHRKLEVVAGGSLLDWQGTSRVRRFNRFCETHLLIPHGFGAGKPMKLYKTQKEWVRSLVSAPITVITVAKGNTKSTLGAALAVWWAADPPPPDIRPQVVIVAGSKDQARAGVFGGCVAMCQDSEWLRERTHYYPDSADPRIVFENGGVIRMRSAHPARIQGIQPSLVVADEIGNFDPKVWHQLVSSLGKRPGAALLGIGTPGYQREVLHQIKDTHQSGQLGAGFAYIEHSADARLSLDDIVGWRQANPIRAEMDPTGWLEQLRLIRASVSDAEFELFHLARWADVRGAPVVDPDLWDTFAGTTIDDDMAEDLGVHVSVSGDWARKNVAVVASVQDGDLYNLFTLGMWRDQPGPVPTAEIHEAVTALGEPLTVTVSRSMQGAELVDELEVAGLAVDDIQTASGNRIRECVDRWLSTVSANSLRHDGNPLLREQVLAARVDVDRKGLTVARDDRADPIHGLLAAAVALTAAAETPVVQIY